MKSLIIADSPEFDTEYVATHARSFDLVVVLDGALQKIPPAVTPHIVCGDFDSLDVDAAKKKFPGVEFVCLPDQNMNDLEKGLLLALERGARKIVVASALGGKPGVSLANTSVMLRHHHQCEMTMIHGSTTLRVLSDRRGAQSHARVAVKEGSEFSCIALENEAVVSLHNVAWELHEQVLNPGSHGVGNTTTASEVSVTVHRGLIVVCYHAAG
jgi:thiamine pyrophosphokinase